jgi:inhibitor of cysteine peptidase
MRFVRFRNGTLNGFVLWGLMLFLMGPWNFHGEVAFAEERIGDGETVVLSKQDSGKRIDMKIGEVVQVELEAMGTAGYQWFVESLDQEILRLVSEETKVLHPGRLGAPVLMIWQFEVIKEGTTEIRMNHYRSWEGKEHSTDHFEVRIKIGR